jgi:hypothetical protein
MKFTKRICRFKECEQKFQQWKSDHIAHILGRARGISKI